MVGAGGALNQGQRVGGGPSLEPAVQREALAAGLDPSRLAGLSAHLRGGPGQLRDGGPHGRVAPVLGAQSKAAGAPPPDTPDASAGMTGVWSEIAGSLSVLAAATVKVGDPLERALDR